MGGLFQVPGSQVAKDGGYEWEVVHRMNEGYKAWGALSIFCYFERKLGNYLHSCTFFRNLLRPEVIFFCI